MEENYQKFHGRKLSKVSWKKTIMEENYQKLSKVPWSLPASLA